MRTYRTAAITQTDIAIRLFKPTAISQGLFASYPEACTQLKSQQPGSFYVTTMSLKYSDDFEKLNERIQEHGISALCSLTDLWLSDSNCDDLEIGLDYSEELLSSAHLITQPQEWALIKRHAHLLAHLGAWVGGYEASEAGRPVAKDTMDHVSPAPINPFTKNEWRFFWGVDVGPNVGSFALKITLIANISAAILCGDERARAITLGQWRMLMQEPRTIINPYEKPWVWFLDLPQKKSRSK